MNPKLIVSDWSGTLITDTTDRPVLKQIAMDELLCSAKHLNPRRVKNLWKTRKKIKAMIQEYGNEPEAQAELLREIYGLYNTEVLAGMPMERIRQSIHKYAEGAEKRLVRPFFNAICHCRSRRTKSVILTSAYDEGVKAAMGTMGDAFSSLFDFVYASRMKINHDGTAMGIDLQNYDNKPEVLESLYNDMLKKDSSFKPSDVMYFGDDFRDEECIGMIGRFIVSPIATQDYKDGMREKYPEKVRTPKMDNNDVIDAITLD